MNSTLPGVPTPPIFFLSPDPLWAIGLETVLPRYHILCVDYSPVVDLLERDGVSIFCLEKELGQRNIFFRNSAKLLAHPATQAFIGKHGDGEQPVILPFKSSASLATLCAQCEYHLAAPLVKISSRYENKLFFSSVLEKVGIAQPPLRQGKLAELSFSTLVGELQLPFVVQFERGFAGNSTHLISSKAIYTDLATRYPTKPAKISAYLRGLPFTSTACVTPHGVLSTPPAFQITGYPAYTPSWGGTCGTTWTHPPLPVAVQRTIAHTIETIGKILAREGFLGIFGIDYLVNLESTEDHPHPVIVIECNPRIVASVPMFTEMQLLAGQVPLLLWHLASFLAPDTAAAILSTTDSNKLFQQEKAMKSPKYTHGQLILRNIHEEEVAYSPNVTTGRHQYFNDVLMFQEQDYSLRTLTDKEILVLTAGDGQCCSPGAEYCRFRTAQPMLSEKWELLPWVKRAAGNLLYI